MKFKTISELFQNNYFSVPDYQRGYEWTQYENSTLLEDILSLIQRPDSDNNHFFGAIVTVPNNLNNSVNASLNYDDYMLEENIAKKYIVDGQQRLTSISILLIAIRDILEQEGKFDKLFVKQKINEEIDPIIQGKAKSKTDSLIYLPRLTLASNAGNYYKTRVNQRYQDKYNLTLKNAKRLKDAYNYYKNELEKREEEFIEENIVKDSQDFYAKVIDTLHSHISFVEIACDEYVDAFQVFDSLNGKGLDLTAVDRIKNIFCSWSPQKTNNTSTYWDDFERCLDEKQLINFFNTLLFWIENTRVNKSRIPEKFRAKYQNLAKENFILFFDELVNYAKIYQSLRNSETDSSEVNQILTDIQLIKSDQAFVLIFSIIARLGLNIITEKDFLKILNSLFVLLIRLQVAEMGMNKLDSLFTECIICLKGKDDSNPLDLLNEIDNKIIRCINKLIPDDKFKTSFLTFSPSENQVSEVYLRHIENYLFKQDNTRLNFDKDRELTVEHIIPTKCDLSI